MSDLERGICFGFGLLVLGGVLNFIVPLFQAPPIVGFPLLVIGVLLGVGLIGAAFTAEPNP